MCASISVTNAFLSLSLCLFLDSTFVENIFFSTGTMSDLVRDTNIKIDDPRYDQNTYGGRGKLHRSERRSFHCVIR